MSIKIYHNPRCTKSRETLAILKEENQAPEIIEYLKTAPTKDELKLIINLLGISPLALIRKGEKLYKSTYKDQDLDDDGWIEVMIKNPILIERPIVVKGNQAVIGRPPERVLNIL